MKTKDGLYIVTDKHFQYFGKRVLFWIDHFGLKDWKITIVQKDLFRNEDSIMTATCDADLEARAARIECCQKSPVDVTKDVLDQWAFHEACELLLWQLRTLAIWRYLPDKCFITEEIHVIIRRLENAVLPYVK